MTKFKPECRGSHKLLPKSDDCVPFDYDANGWPLGVECANGCGAWVCSHKKHSTVEKTRKGVSRYCRTCSQERK